ncbi:MAG TPA: hypothetical protein VMJ72_02435 [Candidatus Paceibacterota bacterium]|nr:hypothetical protein [Candidatus Paceibacterota bacterium]
MSIIPKAGEWVKRHRNILWTGLCLILVAWSTYNLGIIAGRTGDVPLQDAAAVHLRTGIVSQTPDASSGGASSHNDPRVVASKASTSKKYHFTWCPGASKIKAENQLWFPTAAAAESAGYTLAGNCTK